MPLTRIYSSIKNKTTALWIIYLELKMTRFNQSEPTIYIYLFPCSLGTEGIISNFLLRNL